MSFYSRMAISAGFRGKPDTDDNNAIKFSVIELLNQIKSNLHSIFCNAKNIQLEDVEEALLYLSKIGALKLEGGF